MDNNIDITKIREIFRIDQNKPNINSSVQNRISDDEYDAVMEQGNTANYDGMSPNDYDEEFPGFSQEERKLLINKIKPSREHYIYL